MTHTKTVQTPCRSLDPSAPIPPRELFPGLGEPVVFDPAPPLTPDEHYRECVAAVWAWVGAGRFCEHDRLTRGIVEMIEGERRGVIAAKGCSRETP